MILKRPICWLQTLYYTYRYGTLDAIISGHLYYELPEQRDSRGISYQTLECERCGATSVAWSVV